MNKTDKKIGEIKNDGLNAITRSKLYRDVTKHMHGVYGNVIPIAYFYDITVFINKLLKNYTPNTEVQKAREDGVRGFVNTLIDNSSNYDLDRKIAISEIKKIRDLSETYLQSLTGLEDAKK